MRGRVSLLLVACFCIFSLLAPLLSDLRGQLLVTLSPDVYPLASIDCVRPANGRLAQRCSL